MLVLVVFAIAWEVRLDEPARVVKGIGRRGAKTLKCSTPRYVRYVVMNIDLRRPLRRSTGDYLIGGVCGGLARWLGWDPTLVRVLYVLVSVFSAAFPGIIVYLILWLIIPEDVG